MNMNHHLPEFDLYLPDSGKRIFEVERKINTQRTCFQSIVQVIVNNKCFIIFKLIYFSYLNKSKQDFKSLRLKRNNLSLMHINRIYTILVVSEKPRDTVQLTSQRTNIVKSCRNFDKGNLNRHYLPQLNISKHQCY